MSRIILKILLLLRYALFYGGVMNVNKLDLPSNEKFGFFFTFVFAVATVYFYYSANIIWAYVFFAAASIFLFITMIRSDALLPLNKLWMYFGILLGMIVSPIVLGIVFFGLFVIT